MKFAVVYKSMCFGDVDSMFKLFDEMRARGCYGTV